MSMTVTKEAAIRLSDFRLQPRDVVIGRRGEMGRCAVVREQQAGWLCGTGSLIIRCTEGVLPEYLQRVLSSPAVVSAIKDSSVGSTMINLNQGVLADLALEMPPLPEQQAIAEALRDADSLIGGLDRLIAKKRDLKQAAMQQLLTGKRRLPGFSGAWQVRSLGEVAEIVMGQSPAGASYNKAGIGVPLINGPTEFTSRHPIRVQWTTSPTKLCRPGDLLLCVRGSSTGRTNISDDEYCIGRGVAAVRATGEADTAFITFQVTSAVASMLALTTGSTFPNIDGTSLRGIEIPMAPTHREQSAIAAVLSDMDAEIAALERRRDKTRLLKQGMMQELLTGRIRLV
jgi:type I restriction enzyme, S subunit